MGLALASHLLAHSPRKLLLVEEGGLQDDESSSAVPAELNDGDLPSAVGGSRARGFGGSSRRWGGQALPFSRLHLADRPFVSTRGGCPIRWDDLNRFYPEVDRFLGLKPMAFATDLWHNPSVTSPFRSGQELELTISKYSPHAFLASVHQAPIAQSRQVDCLLNAKVSAMHLDEDGTRANAIA